MAKEVIRRNGTTTEHDAFTGANAEITVDTDKSTIVVHDGSTVGGFPVAREDFDNVPDNSVSGVKLEDETVSGSKIVDTSIADEKIIGISPEKVSYDNTDSGLDATEVQAALDETADETGLSLIKDGVDPAVARAVAYNDIGAPVAGGYFAGVIDTIKGTIQSNDDYQTGLRYALIVEP